MLTAALVAIAAIASTLAVIGWIGMLARGGRIRRLLADLDGTRQALASAEAGRVDAERAAEAARAAADAAEARARPSVPRETSAGAA